jgi:pimeloyl-ACP methyl ester carboxylesterase
LVKGLLLVSSCARLPQNYNAFEGLFRVLPGPLRRFVLFASAKRLLFPAGAATGAVQLGLEYLRACPADTVRRDTAAAKAMDLEAAARALRMPVLILCGTRDMLTPLALSQRLHELIPGSELVIVQGAGHMLPLELPERVNQEIVAFMQRVKAGASILPTQLVGDIARGLRGGWLARLRALLFSRGA